MSALVPIIRPRASLQDVCAAAASLSGAGALFEKRLQETLDRRFVRTAGSGIGAFYCLLRGLKSVSSADEVVLPAYTAGSLLVAVRAAGLKPVLCDMSLEDFNMDLRLLPACVSAKTLAVVAVHLFGIPQRGIRTLRASLPAPVVLIEDCCQAMGSMVDARPVGLFSDVSFYSFNRGKNTTLFGGGAVATDDGALDRLADAQLALAGTPAWTAELRTLLNMLLIPAAAWPPLYAVSRRVAAGMRETVPPEQIVPVRLGQLQAAFGLRTCGAWPAQAHARRHNGSVLAAALERISAIQVPRLAQGLLPAYNRFPLLCRDTAHAVALQAALWKAGIESSRMYLEPLPVMFDLGYAADAFPKARELAQRLLTVPVYPGLRDTDVHTMIEVMRTCCR